MINLKQCEVISISISARPGTSGRQINGWYVELQVRKSELRKLK